MLVHAVGRFSGAARSFLSRSLATKQSQPSSPISRRVRVRPAAAVAAAAESPTEPWFIHHPLDGRSAAEVVFCFPRV